MNQLKELFGTLLTSKKFIAMLILMIFVILAYYYGLPTELIITIATGFCTYILGQGFADNGKEAAKVEQQTVLLQEQEPSEYITPDPNDKLEGQ